MTETLSVYVPYINNPYNDIFNIKSLNIANIEAYIDGACSGNNSKELQRFGAYAFVCKIQLMDSTFISWSCVEMSSDMNPTNNTMELMAAILLLRKIKLVYNKKINIYSDSEYVINGINKYIDEWNRNNWRKSNGELVKNKKLWETLLTLKFEHGDTVTFTHIKGHDGNEYNEIADKLCNDAIKKYKSTIHKNEESEY